MEQKLSQGSERQTLSIFQLKQHISELKKSKRYLRASLMFFIVITMILALLLFFNLKIISNPTDKILKQNDSSISKNTLSQSCSKLQLNNSGLANFQFKLHYDNSDIDLINSNQNKQQQKQFKLSPLKKSPKDNQNQKITQLDLSSNKLQRFQDNNLPDLKIINLSFNKLIQFSDNFFPSLEKIEPFYIYGYIQDFSNNYLPKLVETQTKFIAFSSIKNFTNNNMISLSAELYLSSQMTKFQSNLLGATMLYITSLSQELLIYNNTMNKVKQFFLTHKNNTLNMVGNSFEALQVLILSGVQNIQANSFLSLLQINLMGQFSKFTNQYLPSLKKINLFSPSLSDICTGNQMPSLEIMQITANNLTNLNCLNNFKKIQSLDLDVTNFTNFSLPELTFLWLSFNQNSASHSFLNNSFPKIKQMKLFSLKNITSFKQSNIDIGVTLQKFNFVYTNLTNFDLFDKQMPLLTQIHLQSNKLTNINCKNFKNVESLYLSLNKFTDGIIDVLVDCSFNKIKNIFLEENLITDKTKAKAKLLSRYPTAFISL